MEGAVLSHKGGRRRTRPTLSPQQLRDLTIFTQNQAFERSTLKHYATGARDYIDFCHRHRIPLDPTPATLCQYIAYSSLFMASAPKYLTGAQFFLSEFFPDFEKNRKHPAVIRTILGARKVRADPIRRKLPLRIFHLRLFTLKATLSNDYDDLLLATLVSCGFYGCHRLGELVQPNDKSLRDWRKIIKRGSLLFSKDLVRYRLPYNKSDRFFKGYDIWLSNQEFADPVSLLRDYTTQRDSIHGAASPLFLRKDGSPPTRSWFESQFFKIVNREFGGHSLRSGGATFYASLGLSETTIRAAGRWSSKSWKIYVRDNPAVRIQLETAHLLRHS